MYIDRETAQVIDTITREQWRALLKLARHMANQSDEEVEQDNKIQEPIQKTKELHVKVRDVVKEIGVPPHFLGYQYLQEAIILSYNDEKYRRNICKKLYPKIAQKFNTTTSRVERAIRHAIETAFDVGNLESHEKIFKGLYSPMKDKPTNAHAIAALVEYVKEDI